jgi:hypothetical protein
MEVVFPAVTLSRIRSNLQSHACVGKLTIEVQMPLDHCRFEIGAHSNLGDLLNLCAPLILQGSKDDEQDADARQHWDPKEQGRTSGEHMWGFRVARGAIED